MIEYFIKIKRTTRPIFKDRWVWLMAWRDAHVVASAHNQVQALQDVTAHAELCALRAGLVRRAEDWRWSSLWRWAHGERAAPGWLRAWPVPRPQQ